MRTEFDKKLSSVCFRCGVNLLLRQLGGFLFLGGLAVAVAVAAGRVLAVEVVGLDALCGLLAAVVVLAGVYWFRRRPTRMQVALLMDERLGFKERFSTAMALSGEGDAFSRAAVAEAHEAAKNVQPAGRFPVRVTWRWLGAALAWLAAGAIFLFLPAIDLLGRQHRRQAEQQDHRQLQQARSDVQQAAVQVSSAVSRLGETDIGGDLSALARPDANATPQQMKRQAIRKLGDISERLKRYQAGAKLSSARMMQQNLSRLRPSGGVRSGRLNHLLAEGNFAGAARKIQRLNENLAAGKLSPRQQEALARQLADLAGQLDALSRDKRNLEDELKKANLDPRLAECNRKELEDALKRAGLSDEKIEQLLRRCAAGRSACDRMGELSGACASCCGAGGLLSAEGLDELAQQLDAMEAIRLDLAAAEAGLDEIDRAVAMLGECDCQGSGEFSEGLSLRRGRGSGGPGRGMGLRATDDDGETAMKKTLVRNKPRGGPVIASWYFKGAQIKGESRRRCEAVAQAGRDHAAEAISENRIPRKYHETVKKYFGRLEQKAPTSPGGGGEQR